MNTSSFTITWTTSFPSVLAEGGSFTEYASYTSEVASGAHLPWDLVGAGATWSRFWSSYLGSARLMQDPPPDRCWQRAIPFAGHPLLDLELQGPAGTEMNYDVLIYPSAIAVVIRCLYTDPVSLGDLPRTLNELRFGRHFGLSKTGIAAVLNRSLDGIASELTDRFTLTITDDKSALGEAPVVRSIAGPTVLTPEKSTGAPEADLACTNTDAQGVIAALADLAPSAAWNESGLLPANGNARYATRIYVSSGGHAVWNANDFIDPEPRAAHRLTCLHRNHAMLYAQIDAMLSITSWAANRLTAGVEVPVPVQALVSRAAAQLAALHDGTSDTYRCGVAKVRLEPEMLAVTKVLSLF